MANFTVDPGLKRASRIAGAIMDASNLQVVIPAWSPGTHLSIGTIEQVHYRWTWVSRGCVDLVDGAWQLSESTPAVAELVREVLDALGERR